MWEFSLYFDRQLLAFFNKFKHDLKRMCEDELNCVSIQPEEENFVLLLAFSKEFYKKNILFIKNKIAEIICLNYKPKIIKNNIKNFDLNNFENVLLLFILTNIDYYFDKENIVKKLSLCSSLYLNSFVKFQLKAETKKWKEIGCLINQNSLFLFDDGIKNELQKFLLNSIENKTKQVYLSQEQNRFLLKNFDNILIEKMSILNLNNEENSVIFSLINLMPEKIIINQHEQFDVNFVSILYNLFGESIVFS